MIEDIAPKVDRIIKEPGMHGPFTIAEAIEYIDNSGWLFYLAYSIREEPDGYYAVWSYHTTTTLRELR